jgi:phosphoribosylformylglycinamidine (FGAM) synthase-like enzyme
VDVLRRRGGKPPNRDEQNEPDEPASEHCRHPMLRSQMQQLKSP